VEFWLWPIHLRLQSVKFFKPFGNPFQLIFEHFVFMFAFHVCIFHVPKTVSRILGLQPIAFYTSFY